MFLRRGIGLVPKGMYGIPLKFEKALLLNYIPYDSEPLPGSVPLLESRCLSGLTPMLSGVGAIG